MQKDKIKSIRCILAEDMKKYVQLILKEYGVFISEEKQEFLRGIDNYYSTIIVKNSGTISMFATKEGIIMPEGADKIFKYMKMIPGYGINKKHKNYEDAEIVNENTYYDYIKHVFLSGMDVEEFFRDTLLHETMHFCGADGGTAIREGLTELKTRELAQKYDLKASRCGYPKEVDIANRFQKIVGANITNQMTFAQSDKEIHEILQENCGTDIVDLFFEISYLMDEELKAKYDHSKFGGLFGPIKKARAYSQIDYSKIYEKIKIFEAKKVVNNSNQNKQFVDEIRRHNQDMVLSEKMEQHKRKNNEIRDIDYNLK